jgi:DNA-binding ferritin-like protein
MKNCGPDIAKAIGIMFMSRTLSHMSHLQTKSYAEHKALNKFYDEIVDLVDDLAEAAQGQYGILDVPFVNMSGNVNDPIGMLQGHLKQLEATMSMVDEDYLLSIYQEVQKLYRSTLYKLINLS